MNKIYKTAIIGCGGIAGDYDRGTRKGYVSTHVKAYLLEKRTRLVAVADIDPEKAKDFSRYWKIKNFYGEAPRMLEKEKPEIVSICTPDETHMDILSLCLKYPGIKAVWCEKPIAGPSGSAEDIVKKCTSLGVKLAINYQRRWDERCQKIKQIIESGELGKIQKAVIFYGKGVNRSGSHGIDLFSFWLEDLSKPRVFNSFFDYDKEDLTLDARFECGGVPVYLIGTDERAYSLFEIQIFGTLGRIIVKRGGLVEFLRAKEDSEFEGHRKLESSKVDFKMKTYPMSAALNNIIDAIETDVPILSDGFTALRTLNLCRSLLQLEKERIK